MSNQFLEKIKAFHQAKILLAKGRFGDSMSFAKKVLAKANLEEDISQNINALHLIVDVNNTQGRYQNNNSLFKTSLEYLNQITRRSSRDCPKDCLWATQLKQAQTHLLLKQFDEAEIILIQCLKDEVLLDESIERKVELLLTYSEFHYLQNEYDKAISYTISACRLLEEKEREELLLEAYAQKVKIYLRKHEYAGILDYALKTIELSRKYRDHEKEFIGLNAKAVYYSSRYDFKTAMLYFRNAVDKSSEIGYRHGTAYCLVNIGTIYANLYNYNKALDSYMTIFNEYGDILDDNTAIVILNNMGNIYFTVDKLDEALDYFERSLNMAKRIGYNEMKAHTMAQISRTLVAKGDYDKALEYANESEKIIEDSGNDNGKQINLITLGNIYSKIENFDLALKYVGKGIVRSKQVKDSVSEIKGYRLMSNIFEKKKDYKKALEYQLIYSQAQEKYANSQRNMQIIDVELKYDFQKKEKELELLKKYKDRLAFQNDRIAEQNKKLLKANNDLMQFAYAASHDLKEPLRMIGSYSQLIQRRYRHQIDSSSDEFFEYVNEGVSRMTKLLDDLLKYATIGKEEEQHLEEVSLTEILEITEFNLQLVIEESKTKIFSENLPTIYTNRAYISQLFQNLISNSVKFRREDVSPIITISYEKKDGEHIISFEDNGIGIPADALERIFVIFQRLHKRDGYSGTGIGLSICMKIIDKLGGGINVESERNVGSKFIVMLPEEPPTSNDSESIKDIELDEGF